MLELEFLDGNSMIPMLPLLVLVVGIDSIPMADLHCGLVCDKLRDVLLQRRNPLVCTSDLVGLIHHEIVWKLQGLVVNGDGEQARSFPKPFQVDLDDLDLLVESFAKIPFFERGM
jgi:hypothetical protein